jgi:hypothetical protein
MIDPASCSSLSSSEAYFPAHMQCDKEGLLLWQTSTISSDPAVFTIEYAASGRLFVQTSTSIIALSSANGEVFWQSPIQNASKMRVHPNANIVCLSDNASKLQILDGSTGNCLQTISSPLFANSAPVVSTSGHICMLQKNKKGIFVYDEALRHVGAYILGEHELDNIFMLENTLVAISSQMLICRDTQKDFSQYFPLSALPRATSKASSHALFIEYQNGEKCVFDVQARAFIPLAISMQPQTHPLVLEDGACGILYQSMIHQGFEDTYTISFEEGSGKTQWQVKERVEPRFMLVDVKKRIVVAFSPSHETVRLASPFQPAPSCYIKIFDLQGRELHKHVSNQPILSPLACDANGHIYFYSDGKVQALGTR